MLEIIDVPSDHVIGLQIDGKINKKEIDKAWASIQSALQFNPSVNIYVEIDKLDGLSLGAIYEDLKLALPRIHRFRKEAVVSDQTSLKKWVKLGNSLWWRGEARYFTLAEKKQALDWVQT